VSSPTADSQRVRIAGSVDVEALVSLINAAFKVERFFIEGDRIDAGTIRELMKTGQFLIVQDRDFISACVYVEPRGDRAYVGLLAVNPVRQRSGLGSQAMAAAENHARSSGCRYVDLRIVNVRSELPGFYQPLGYVITGVSSFTPGVVTKQPCHFINMSKILA
jgi:N-acetylglutamate synthase-like GNAT family acetyltransferase